MRSEPWAVSWLRPIAIRTWLGSSEPVEQAEPVLAHRLVLSPEARMRNMTAQRVLANVLSAVQVPVKAR